MLDNNYTKSEKGNILCVDQIEETGRIIKPPSAEEYPYEAYEFADMQEVKSYREKAENECEDSLYEKAKCIEIARGHCLMREPGQAWLWAVLLRQV